MESVLQPIKPVENPPTPVRSRVVAHPLVLAVLWVKQSAMNRECPVNKTGGARLRVENASQPKKAARTV